MTESKTTDISFNAGAEQRAKDVAHRLMNTPYVTQASLAKRKRLTRMNAYAGYLVDRNAERKVAADAER